MRQFCPLICLLIGAISAGNGNLELITTMITVVITEVVISRANQGQPGLIHLDDYRI